jgi:hypothetical protein
LHATSLILQNAAEVTQIWQSRAVDPAVSCIIIRHAQREDDKDDRGWVSRHGHLQLRCYRSAIEDSVRALMRRGLSLCASRTARTSETIFGLVPNDAPDFRVEYPRNLDIPFLGPNSEDLLEAHRLAGEHGIHWKVALRRLEEYGVTRLGVHPSVSRPLVRQGCIDIVRAITPGVLLYACNMPLTLEALQIEWTDIPSELTAFFLDFDGEQFHVLERIEPVFVEGS